MATWAIGDVQGCHRSFRALLERVGFDPARDTLWLAGDLVNRGPGSLDVLRDCVRWPDAVVAVLGNHDLHLLARAAGVAKAGKRDTLEAVLAAPDRHTLLDWLAARPLLVRGAGHVMVHAGLLPHWTLDAAEALATAASERLRALPPARGLGALRGARPFGEAWARARRDDAARAHLVIGDDGVADLRSGGGRDPARLGAARLAAARELPDDVLIAAAAALTRLRACDSDGRMASFAGELRDVPIGVRPWFAHRPERFSVDEPVIFGHWSALHTLDRPGLVGLDSGCFWGQRLTAYCLEDRSWLSVPCMDEV